MVVGMPLHIPSVQTISFPGSAPASGTILAKEKAQIEIVERDYV
jgi:hypothetical protein